LSPSSVIHIRILLLIALLAVPVSGWAGQEPGTYRDELIDQARLVRLAETREWRLLLHYQDNLFGGVTSEQDDERFFLSLQGKHDPEAELKATIEAFFSPVPLERSKQPAQCTFIARYRWLKERLRFDDGRLAPLVCERFDRWRAELNPQGISLIFPAAFMNNPASMFGHTFLRIDQKGQTEQTRILAYTIDYAAEVPPDVGLEYAYKGIFGGYKGFFSTPPYYLKVQAYRDIENRDMWEYRLNLTPDQVERLIMHAWEMGSAYFDYFFFKENCSYHILSLLEYANPELHLREQFHLYTIPADTVRAVVASPGLVGATTYRPSRSTIIKRKRAILTPGERRAAQQILHDPESARETDFAAMPVLRRALILDVVSDYLRYKAESDDPEVKIHKERNRQVLTERSRLLVPSEEVVILPYTERPDAGHRTSRASIGAGWRNHDSFQEVSLRAAYHDLLDPEVGYTPDAQIEMVGATLRHYNQPNQVRLERATLLNIVSLSPMDELFHGPSWKVNLGMNTIRHNGCQLCSNGVASGGIGASMESGLLKREVYFAFAEAEANYSTAYDEHHRIGGGGTIGMLADLTDRWKVMLSGSYLRYALGEQSEDIRWFVGSRYTLSQNWALRAEYNHRDRDDDVALSIQAFF
jgi:hypothetical protein